MAAGSLAERYDVHQHGAARARRPDAVALAAAVEVAAASVLLEEGVEQDQHHAEDAVDAEPWMPEAGVGVVYFDFGLRDGATLILRRHPSSATVQSFCLTLSQRCVGPPSYGLASSSAT